jgi:nitrite reductase/ring-hydroxylating ferredoxin subunit
VSEFVPVCPIEELPPGASRLFRRGTLDIAIFNVDGALFAIEDTCLHAGGPLHEGGTRGTTVICPWHHWEFDLRDGSCALNPHHKLACYPVRVVDGEVQLGLR